jgi:hypothetical protein
MYMRSALFFDFTQRIMVDSYRRFGTKYQSLGFPETSVESYHSTLLKIQKNRILLPPLRKPEITHIQKQLN